MENFNEDDFIPLNVLLKYINHVTQLPVSYNIAKYKLYSGKFFDDTNSIKGLIKQFDIAIFLMWIYEEKVYIILRSKIFEKLKTNVC